jgi:glycosyltransferase involved in cell wall biosynthesis
MDKKIKVLIDTDHILSPSGVATTTKMVAEALLKSGKFCIRQLGGALKHSNYNVVKTQEYGEDLIIFPVDGYGSPDIVRSIIRTERPDIFLIVSDPRFWVWLFNIEDEFRPLMPLVYWHLWDHADKQTMPTFNLPYYRSCDHIALINKLSNNIIDTICPEISHEYLPHTVNTDIFQPFPKERVMQFRKDTFKNAVGETAEFNKFIFFYNGRNARRKQTGSMIFWFCEFLDIVGRDKATLLMHTDPKDPNGQDLEAIIQHLDLVHGEVLFSRDKIAQEGLALINNMVDCAINLSDAEGFGCPIAEALACGTPAIVTMTGGVQDQITDGTNYFGVGIKPVSRAVIGSQDIPWILEDRLSKEDVVNAMLKMYNMTSEEREKLGRLGRENVMKNFNFEKHNQRWINLMLEVYEKYGSWETRKGYKNWEIKAL